MESPWTDPWSEESKAPNPTRRYGLCRVAFWLGALAVGLQSADILIRVVSVFVQVFFGMGMARANGGAQAGPPGFLNQNLKLLMLMNDDRWGLFIGTPISWAAALGALLLIGRWRESSWNRRVLLLVMMNLFDVYLWAEHNGPLLGLNVPQIDNSWVRYSVSVLQWFELILFGSLAAEVALHLGRQDAARMEQKSRSFAIVGLGIWTLVLLIGTHLRPGGLPAFQFRVREAYFLYMMSEVVLALTAFQVMILCMLASRDCSQILKELRAREHEHGFATPDEHGGPR